MTDYTFSKVAVYAELAGALRLASNARSWVTDPVSGLPVDVTQGARTAPYLDTDANGIADFTATTPGPLRLTTGAVFVDVFSEELPGLGLAAVTSSSASADAAASSAASAAASASLVGAPADTAVATIVGNPASATSVSLAATYARATPRTNIGTNPRAIAGNGGWISTASATWSATFVTSGFPVHPLGITTAVRGNVLATATSTYAVALNSPDNLGAVGPARRLGVWVCSMEPGYQVNPYGGYTLTPLTAGVWTFVKTTTTLAAGDTSRIAVSKIAGNAVSTDMVYATGCVTEAGGTVGNYFDGSTPPTAGLTYAWTGTANASTSTEMLTTAAGAITSGTLADARLPVTAQAATLDARLTGLIKGAAGRNLRIVAGVIRNAGAAWQPIADASHAGVNVDSVSTSTTAITINHAAIGATKVVSFITGVDETLASAGFVTGTSVGLTSSTIKLTKVTPLADFVSYDGAAWSSANGVFACAFTAGVLTLTHALLPGGVDIFDVHLTGRGGTVPVGSSNSGSVTETVIKIEFRDWAGALITAANTAMKAFVSCGATGSLDPQRVNTALYPNSNLWFIGIFEVAA